MRRFGLFSLLALIVTAGWYLGIPYTDSNHNSVGAIALLVTSLFGIAGVLAYFQHSADKKSSRPKETPKEVSEKKNVGLSSSAEPNKAVSLSERPSPPIESIEEIMLSERLNILEQEKSRLTREINGPPQLRSASLNELHDKISSLGKEIYDIEEKLSVLQTKIEMKTGVEFALKNKLNLIEKRRLALRNKLLQAQQNMPRIPDHEDEIRMELSRLDEEYDKVFMQLEQLRFYKQ